MVEHQNPPPVDGPVMQQARRQDAVTALAATSLVCARADKGAPASSAALTTRDGGSTDGRGKGTGVWPGDGFDGTHRADCLLTKTQLPGRQSCHPYRLLTSPPHGLAAGHDRPRKRPAGGAPELIDAPQFLNRSRQFAIRIKRNQMTDGHR